MFFVIIIAVKGEMTLKDVLIKSKIKNDNEEIFYEGKGKIDSNKNLLQYHDKNALLTIFFNDNIMLRETEDSILSYKFVKNEKTNFEVYLKDLKQTGLVPMKTFTITKKVNFYEVVYQIEGNDFKHTYNVEWRYL